MAAHVNVGQSGERVGFRIERESLLVLRLCVRKLVVLLQQESRGQMRLRILGPQRGGLAIGRNRLLGLGLFEYPRQGEPRASLSLGYVAGRFELSGVTQKLFRIWLIGLRQLQSQV